MKKFLIFIVLLIIVCVVGAQFVVPKYMESIVEDELNQSLKPSSQTVVIESTPAFKLVYGQADVLVDSRRCGCCLRPDLFHERIDGYPSLLHRADDDVLRSDFDCPPGEMLGDIDCCRRLDVAIAVEDA